MGYGCSTHGTCIKNVGRKPEGKRPLGNPRHRWEDNIKMYIKRKECESVDWIHLAQDKFQWQVFLKTVMRLRIPQKAGNVLTS